MFPILAFLGSAGLMVLVLRAGMISSGDEARVSTNYKLWMSPGVLDPLSNKSGGAESHHLARWSYTWVSPVNSRTSFDGNIL